MVAKILEVFQNKSLETPPIWLMRQAGRYLPEYKETRKKAGSFLDLCYNPDLACEVTLQPLRRFDLDAAIIFSDILVIPHALGQNLTFEEGVGPLLSPLEDKIINKFITEKENLLEKLSPIFLAIEKVKKHLTTKQALIGFCGAPFTVSTYMIAGRSSTDQAATRSFIYKDRKKMQDLIDLLTEASIIYLSAQIEAGADLVQIFDSWCNVLNEEDFKDFCVKPMRKTKDALSKTYNVPVIAFPKGAGLNSEHYVENTKVDGLSIDWTMPLDYAKKLQSHCVIQGNLDPLSLVIGGEQMEKKAQLILEKLSGKNFIFNLGHGILPTTPIKNVENLIALIKNYKKT